MEVIIIRETTTSEVTFTEKIVIRVQVENLELRYRFL